MAALTEEEHHTDLGRIPGETNAEFFLRIQARDREAAMQHNQVPNSIHTRSRTCGRCGAEHAVSLKKCNNILTSDDPDVPDEPCNNRMDLSQEPLAVASRVTRAKNKRKRWDKNHNFCGYCRGSLSKGNFDLCICLCTKDGTLAPCGRAMHLKCLQKHLKSLSRPHSTFGRLPLKCVSCNGETQAPHFVELWLPRK